MIGDPDKVELTVWGKVTTVSGRRMQKMYKKELTKLEQDFHHDKRPFVYWKEDEHKRFIEAVELGLGTNYEKLTAHI